MSKERKRRPLWRRIGFAIVAVLLFLLVVETGLQISKRLIRKDPTVSGETDDCESIVILCVGDSMTYGLGAKPEEAYPMQLPRFFRRQYGGLPVKVYNLGMPGSNTSEGCKRVRSFLTTSKQARPDVALILYGVNNRWNLHDAGFWKWNKEAKKENFADYLTSRFQLNKLLKVTVSDRRARQEQGKYKPKKEYHEMLNEHGWEMFFSSFRDDLLFQWLKRDLADLSQELRKRNIEPVFLTYHYPRFPELNPVLKEIGQEVLAVVLDIEQPFEYYRKAGMFDPDLFHLNARGYKNMARRVVLKLRERYDPAAMREILETKKQSDLCRADP